VIAGRYRCRETVSGFRAIVISSVDARMGERRAYTTARANPGVDEDVLSGVLSSIRLSGSLQFCFMPAGDWQTDDKPAFNRAFSRSFGAPPAAWRQKARSHNR
jgi:hypothetical protein